VNSILVVLPEEMVGNTDAKNSSQFSTNTVSSMYRNEIDLPRMAEEDVDVAITLHPFSNSTEPLFHSITPCFSHFGSALYAILIRSRISRASLPLFARSATVL
jgi:hypothetical protein